MPPRMRRLVAAAILSLIVLPDWVLMLESVTVLAKGFEVGPCCVELQSMLPRMRIWRLVVVAMILVSMVLPGLVLMPEPVIVSERGLEIGLHTTEVRGVVISPSTPGAPQRWSGRWCIRHLEGLYSSSHLPCPRQTDGQARPSSEISE